MQQSPSSSKDGTQSISVSGSVFQPIAVILLPMSREAFSAFILIPWPISRSQSQCWNQHPQALPYVAWHRTEPASKLRVIFPALERNLRLLYSKPFKSVRPSRTEKTVQQLKHLTPKREDSSSGSQSPHKDRLDCMYPQSQGS